MSKVRVYELAKALGVESKDIITKLEEVGEYVKSASSTVEAPVIRRLHEKFPELKESAAKAPAPAKKAPAKKVAKAPEAPQEVATEVAAEVATEFDAPTPAADIPVQQPAAEVTEVKAAPIPGATPGPRPGGPRPGNNPFTSAPRQPRAGNNPFSSGASGPRTGGGVTGAPRPAGSRPGGPGSRASGDRPSGFGGPRTHQADQVGHVQVAIVQAVSADLARVDLAVSADLVQAAIDRAVLLALVQAHQVAHQVERQVADQVAGLIQLVAVEILLAHLVNQAAGHRRVVSQSALSVKSSTT